MSRDDPQFKLRIPSALKLQIDQAAAENHRSLNAEILARLEESFENSAVPMKAVMNASSDQVIQILLAVQAELAEMKQVMQSRKP